MAVNANVNPIVVAAADAADTDLIAAATVQIAGIRWVGATTNAHTAVVKDNAGIVKWASAAATATLGIVDDSCIPFRTTGLRVPTLASGTLYIYLKDGD